MPPTDDFSSLATGLDSPSAVYDAITPNDGADLAKVTRGIGVQNAGNLKVTRPDGTAVTIAVPAGVLPIRAARVWSTGTTATGLVAFY